MTIATRALLASAGTLVSTVRDAKRFFGLRSRVFFSSSLRFSPATASFECYVKIASQEPSKQSPQPRVKVLALSEFGRPAAESLYT